MGRSEADAAAPASGSDAPIIDGALNAFPPGKTLHIDCGAVSVEIAPEAGGRIAQITHQGVEWLLGYSPDNDAMIAWGCYPMLPWAGRIRSGRFEFEGRSYQLPVNLGHHAIHGLGFALPWQVESHAAHCIELSLTLPEDQRWPFGGRAFQRIEAGPRWLRLELSVTAGEHAMPAVIGWHPWLRKPEHLHFAPTHVYPRDVDGIATLPLADPPAPPWDDCFINQRPLEARRRGRTLRLASNCRHWVVYDQPAHATCIEPQSGPPDAFNLEPNALAPGESCSAWFLWEWI
jgi:aldose 1-epimerase